MSKRPEIEKIHVLHKLESEFEVSEEVRESLHSQLTDEDVDRISRFTEGFTIEDWFRWIYSAMPWAQLIHGLHQQQSPVRSKTKFQVPDYLTVFETSSLTSQPLLVEVKRVARNKMSLEIRDSQLALCEQYASAIGVPLVYAVYWQHLNAWTLNTPDSFESKSSTRKLRLEVAFELDCGNILGDISFLVPDSLVRVSIFDRNGPTGGVRHENLGSMVSDVVSIGDIRVEMDSIESAAIDSTFSLVDLSRESDGDRTTLVQRLPEMNMRRLSSWITHHLSIFGIAPTEEHSNVSAHTIVNLMDKLQLPKFHMFPTGRSPQIQKLDELFRMSEGEQKQVDVVE